MEKSANILDTQRLKAEALRLGFSACGVAPAQPVEAAEAGHLQAWLSAGRQGEMAYMANHLDKRLNPALLMEGAVSVISLALNYCPPQRLDSASQYEFSYYAYGKDYHDVMKERLNALLDILRQWTPFPLQARVFCDTAPLLERYWAWRCGLGWIGKHTQLVIPRAGSYFFLGEILIDCAFTRYDTPVKSRCGTCRACLDACPTHALVSPRQLDASRCLSYLTIEYRGETLPATTAKAMGNCIYGCDRCQQACPWNRFAIPTQIAALHPSDAFMQATRAGMDSLSVEEYRTLFKGSAVKRAKYEGLMRNIRTTKTEK